MPRQISSEQTSNNEENHATNIPSRFCTVVTAAESINETHFQVVDPTRGMFCLKSLTTAISPLNKYHSKRRLISPLSQNDNSAVATVMTRVINPASKPLTTWNSSLTAIQFIQDKGKQQCSEISIFYIV